MIIGKHIDEARRSIDAMALVNALESHALGDIKMTATQVSASLALLKKVMPDISSSSIKGDKDKKSAVLTHEQALKELE